MPFSISLNRRLDFTDEENYEDFGEVDDIESDMSDPSQNRSVYQKDGQNFCNSLLTPSNSKVNITLLLFYKLKISVDYIKACLPISPKTLFANGCSESNYGKSN